MENIENSMRLFHDNMVVNWHEHVWESSPGVLDETRFLYLLDAADKTGMNHLLCSCPITTDRFCPPERFRMANDVVVRAMKMHPDLVLGMCFINPGYGQAALDEIDRCINDLGMVGIKMYHQYFINDPVQFPIIEKCIDLDIPILVHAGKLCHDPLSQPHVSNGVHFADVAKRYPEANFIMAHIGGGGDWYWSLKAIENSPNVVTDMSGSVYDRDIMEKTVAYLGADRVLFGTDGSLSPGVGKILAADISEEDKKTILSGGKYMRFIERVRNR